MTDIAGQAPAQVLQLLQQDLPQHVLAGFMRYQKIKPLGRGGKAEVLLCRDVTLGREVAVKVLHRELLSAPLEQHMLVREARIMAALAHPGIPKIHDLGRDFEGRPYFAMSYIAGATLREILEATPQELSRNAQQYSLQRRLGILIETAEILSMAHSLSVLHCDLKPENLLIAADESVHVIDWGLATVQYEADTEDGEVAFTAERGRQGSPLYMSPEQAAHNLPLDLGTDVYSLGVLLYECLTFDTPCRGEVAEHTFANIVDTAPIPPRELAPDQYITSELERVCLKALSKRTAERYKNMSDFAAELRDCRLDLLIRYERDALGECGPYAHDLQSCRDERLLTYV